MYKHQTRKTLLIVMHYSAADNEAVNRLTGVDYEPVAYLGSQVVSGLNHCYLAKATVVTVFSISFMKYENNFKHFFTFA